MPKLKSQKIGRFVIDYFYGDCVGTYDYKISEFKKHNKIAYKLLNKKYGNNWKTKFNNEVEVQILIPLKGDVYTQKRNDFLKNQRLLSAPAPEEVGSVHYKIQYSILRAWKTDFKLFDTILEDLRNVDVLSHSHSNPGFTAVFNDFRGESRSEWQEKGLPHRMGSNFKIRQDASGVENSYLFKYN